MKKEDEDPEKTDNQDEETDDLNIEGLTEVQGGIDHEDETDCGLGCYVGSGAGTNDKTEPDSLD